MLNGCKTETDQKRTDAEELHLFLTQDGFGEIAADFINRWLKKKARCSINVRLDQVCIDYADGKLQIHADLNAELPKEELIKLMRSS